MNLGRNVVWGLSESLIRILATFFVNVLIARHLGPASYGTLSAAFVVVSWASAFGGLGLDPLVIREMSGKDHRAQSILGSAFHLRGLAALSSVLVLLVLALIKTNFFSELSGSMWSAVLLMALLIPFQPVAFGYGNAFGAFLRADLLTIGKTTGLVIATGCRIVGLLTGLNFLFFAGCHVIEHLVSTFFVRRNYKKELEPKIGQWTSDKETLKVLVDGGKWLFISALVVSILQGAGVILLKGLSSAMETGIYAGALRLALVLQFVPGIISKTFLPVVVSVRDAEGLAGSARMEKELFRLLWLFGYSAALFFLIAGDWIVPFILGEEYRASSEPLKILAVMLIPLSVGAARTVYFAKDRAYKKLLAADVSGAVLTVLLGLLFIPRYGANGAAVASLAAASIGYIVVPYLILERGKQSSKEVLKAAVFPFPSFKLLFQAKLNS